MADDTWCLGLEVLGQIHYDPLHPVSSFFSIGEGVAAVAIFVTFDTLLGTRQRFRLLVVPGFVWGIVGLLAAGVGCTWIAALHPAFAPLPLQSPILFELAAATLFLSALAFASLRFSTPIKYSKWNAGRYFRGCIRIIARGKPDEVADLAEEIRVSAAKLVSVASSVNWYAFREPNKREPRHVSHARYAITIIEALADDVFASVAIAARAVDSR